MEKIKTLVAISGTYGLLGTAFCDYCKDNAIDFIPVLPFPCDLGALRELLTNNKITHFVNCAGYSNDKLSMNNSYRTFDSNVHCVINQLEAIREFSPKTAYMNFGSIYEIDRDTPYAASKRASREIINSYVKSNNLRAAQATLSYTEYLKQDANRFLQRIIRNLIAIKNNKALAKLNLYNGDDFFYFTWATDVAEATLNFFTDTRILSKYEPYFISPHGFRLKEIVGILLNELELHNDLVSFSNNSENGGGFIEPCYYPTIEPKVSMNQIIKNLVKFELEQINNPIPNVITRKVP